MQNILIDLINPWSGVCVRRDVTNITDDEIQGYALDADVCEQVRVPADATPGEWLAAYVAIVGAETAGAQIIGS